jgi:putative ABC transport system permease protein
MRRGDLLGLAFSALGRQKVRTALTVLGVTIGTFTLVASLAIGRGVDSAILALFHDTDALRQVGVYINYETVAEDVPEAERRVEGSMSDAKRDRIRRALVRRWDRRNITRPKAKLDLAALEALGRQPHVERVVPFHAQEGRAELSGIGGPQDVTFSSVAPEDDYRRRIVAGRPLGPDEEGGAVVHEFLLYRLGLVGDEEVRRALGRPIRLEFQVSGAQGLSLERLLTFGPRGLSESEAEALVRALRRLAPVVRLLPLRAEERASLLKLAERIPAEDRPVETRTYGRTFTVVGVVREPAEGEPSPLSPFGNYQSRGDVLIPAWSAARLYFQAPEYAENGVNSAVLVVDRDANVEAVAGRAEAMGYQQSSLVQVIGTVRLNVLLITFAVAFVAVVALTVAALGITNTMIMSVLERTHEIGVMKAVGARDGQILAIFLVEGGVIGLLGGLLGLGLAWLASFPGDAVAKSIMEPQAHRPIEGSLFAFPTWLVLGGPALAALITTLAAVYPAHRAARVDPITSLRHD